MLSVFVELFWGKTKGLITLHLDSSLSLHHYFCDVQFVVCRCNCTQGGMCGGGGHKQVAPFNYVEQSLPPALLMLNMVQCGQLHIGNVKILDCEPSLMYAP